MPRNPRCPKRSEAVGLPVRCFASHAQPREPARCTFCGRLMLPPRANFLDAARAVLINLNQQTDDLAGARDESEVREALQAIVRDCTVALSVRPPTVKKA